MPHGADPSSASAVPLQVWVDIRTRRVSIAGRGKGEYGSTSAVSPEPKAPLSEYLRVFPVPVTWGTKERHKLYLAAGYACRVPHNDPRIGIISRAEAAMHHAVSGDGCAMPLDPGDVCLVVDVGESAVEVTAMSPQTPGTTRAPLSHSIVSGCGTDSVGTALWDMLNGMETREMTDFLVSIREQALEWDLSKCALSPDKEGCLMVPVPSFALVSLPESIQGREELQKGSLVLTQEETIGVLGHTLSHICASIEEHLEMLYGSKSRPYSNVRLLLTGVGAECQCIEDSVVQRYCQRQSSSGTLQGVYAAIANVPIPVIDVESPIACSDAGVVTNERAEGHLVPETPEQSILDAAAKLLEDWSSAGKVTPAGDTHPVPRWIIHRIFAKYSSEPPAGLQSRFVRDSVPDPMAEQPLTLPGASTDTGVCPLSGTAAVGTSKLLPLREEPQTILPREWANPLPIVPVPLVRIPSSMLPLEYQVQLATGPPFTELPLHVQAVLYSCDVPDGLNETALVQAVERGCLEEGIASALHYTAVDGEGATLAHRAVYIGDTTLLAQLQDNGVLAAALHRVDNYGRTPCEVALHPQRLHLLGTYGMCLPPCSAINLLGGLRDPPISSGAPTSSGQYRPTHTDCHKVEYIWEEAARRGVADISLLTGNTLFQSLPTLSPDVMGTTVVHTLLEQIPYVSETRLHSLLDAMLSPKFAAVYAAQSTGWTSTAAGSLEAAVVATVNGCSPLHIVARHGGLGAEQLADSLIKYIGVEQVRKLWGHGSGGAVKSPVISALRHGHTDLAAHLVSVLCPATEEGLYETLRREVCLEAVWCKAESLLSLFTLEEVHRWCGLQCLEKKESDDGEEVEPKTESQVATDSDNLLLAACRAPGHVCLSSILSVLPTDSLLQYPSHLPSCLLPLLRSGAEESMCLGLVSVVPSACVLLPREQEELGLMDLTPAQWDVVERVIAAVPDGPSLYDTVLRPSALLSLSSWTVSLLGVSTCANRFAHDSGPKPNLWDRLLKIPQYYTDLIECPPLWLLDLPAPILEWILPRLAVDDLNTTTPSLDIVAFLPGGQPTSFAAALVHRQVVSTSVLVPWLRQSRDRVTGMSVFHVLAQVLLALTSPLYRRYTHQWTHTSAEHSTKAYVSEILSLFGGKPWHGYTLELTTQDWRYAARLRQFPDLNVRCTSQMASAAIHEYCMYLRAPDRRHVSAMAPLLRAETLQSDVVALLEPYSFEDPTSRVAAALCRRDSVQLPLSDLTHSQWDRLQRVFTLARLDLVSELLRPKNLLCLAEHTVLVMEQSQRANPDTSPLDVGPLWTRLLRVPQGHLMELITQFPDYLLDLPAEILTWVVPRLDLSRLPVVHPYTLPVGPECFGPGLLSRDFLGRLIMSKKLSTQCLCRWLRQSDRMSVKATVLLLASHILVEDTHPHCNPQQLRSNEVLGRSESIQYALELLSLFDNPAAWADLPRITLYPKDWSLLSSLLRFTPAVEPECYYSSVAAAVTGLTEYLHWNTAKQSSPNYTGQWLATRRFPAESDLCRLFNNISQIDNCEQTGPSHTWDSGLIPLLEHHHRELTPRLLIAISRCMSKWSSKERVLLPSPLEVALTRLILEHHGQSALAKLLLSLPTRSQQGLLMAHLSCIKSVWPVSDSSAASIGVDDVETRENTLLGHYLLGVTYTKPSELSRTGYTTVPLSHLDALVVAEELTRAYSDSPMRLLRLMFGTETTALSPWRQAARISSLWLDIATASVCEDGWQSRSQGLLVYTRAACLSALCDSARKIAVTRAAGCLLDLPPVSLREVISVALDGDDHMWLDQIPPLASALSQQLPFAPVFSLDELGLRPGPSLTRLTVGIMHSESRLSRASIPLGLSLSELELVLGSGRTLHPLILAQLLSWARRQAGSERRRLGVLQLQQRLQPEVLLSLFQSGDPFLTHSLTATDILSLLPKCRFSSTYWSIANAALRSSPHCDEYRVFSSLSGIVKTASDAPQQQQTLVDSFASHMRTDPYTQLHCLLRPLSKLLPSTARLDMFSGLISLNADRSLVSRVFSDFAREGAQVEHVQYLVDMYMKGLSLGPAHAPKFQNREKAYLHALLKPRKSLLRLVRQAIWTDHPRLPGDIVYALGPLSEEQLQYRGGVFNPPSGCKGSLYHALDSPLFVTFWQYAGKNSDDLLQWVSQYTKRTMNTVDCEDLQSFFRDTRAFQRIVGTTVSHVMQYSRSKRPVKSLVCGEPRCPGELVDGESVIPESQSCTSTDGLDTATSSQSTEGASSWEQWVDASNSTEETEERILSVLKGLRSWRAGDLVVPAMHILGQAGLLGDSNQSLLLRALSHAAIFACSSDTDISVAAIAAIVNITTSLRAPTYQTEPYLTEDLREIVYATVVLQALANLPMDCPQRTAALAGVELPSSVLPRVSLKLLGSIPLAPSKLQWGLLPEVHPDVWSYVTQGYTLISGKAVLRTFGSLLRSAVEMETLATDAPLTSSDGDNMQLSHRFVSNML
ncbi:hypothetical protein KIPB_001120 [Kipferlia bialata]|uniref:Uncharacterized protein n=1 Tax=Kipferlia bialata TaxID=797122 RepID=A0A9K3GFA4_9EUKA|nr:hypothetical protein KIPB_001120 [Kipferlia bialata]|eukprot:g1120.t1